MIRVVIESPLSGNRERNKLYAYACARDCLRRGESPYASHLFFDHPELLDDVIPEERELGIKAGFAWGEAAELRAVYTDLGISGGMELGIAEAKRLTQRLEYRTLPEAELKRFEKAQDWSARLRDQALAIERAWRGREPNHVLSSMIQRARELADKVKPRGGEGR